jgi:hypothetical protein
MSEQTVEDVVQSLMAQVAVVADAKSKADWAIDNGEAKDHFDYEREELEDQLNTQLGDVHERLQGMIDGIRFLQKWHEQNLESLQIVSEGAVEGVVLQIGGVEDIKLTADMAKGVFIGVTIALGLFGKLPISLTENEEEGDDD